MRVITFDFASEAIVCWFLINFKKKIFSKSLLLLHCSPLTTIKIHHVKKPFSHRMKKTEIHSTRNSLSLSLSLASSLHYDTCASFARRCSLSRCGAISVDTSRVPSLYSEKLCTRERWPENNILSTRARARFASFFSSLPGMDRIFFCAMA